MSASSPTIPPSIHPVVRPTVPADVPGILALVGEIYAEYGCVLDAEHEDTHLLDPGPYFRARGGEFWVVESGGAVLATGAVALLADAGELRSLYVHRCLRRQGWGRRLTERAMQHAQGAGRQKMVLWTDTRFLAAHALYESLGFRRCGVRELHDSNQTREYGYEKPLI
jgi:N-acetylglutamate synthase-like GNAT family acetyltransferase